MEIYRCEGCQKNIISDNINQEVCFCGLRINSDYIQTEKNFDKIFSGIINGGE